MGDEWETSSMSELFTTELSTVQGAEPRTYGRGCRIAVVGLLAIVAVAGILFASGVFKSHGSSEDDTEEEAAGISSSGNGGGDDDASSFPDVYPSPDSIELPARTTTATTTFTESSEHNTEEGTALTSSSSSGGAAAPTPRAHSSTASIQPPATTTTMMGTTRSSAGHTKEEAAPSSSTPRGGDSTPSSIRTPPPTPSARPTTASTRPTTTTTISPTPALVPRTVMCTTQSTGLGNDPPQHLCDIVVYDAGYEDLQVSRPAAAESFVDYCRKSRTVCGLNIERLYRVSSYLYKRDAETAMRNFYAAGIKNYGFLRTALTASSKPEDVRFAAELLAKLQKFLKVTGKNRDILFWGVTPILEGASSPPDAMMEVFLGVLKSVSVNMLVYQTTHAGSSLSSDPGCLSTGPAMWMSAPLSTQPTFVDALNFWKAVRAQNLLPDVQEMFTITLCGFVTRYKSKVAKPLFGVKTDCDQARSGPVEDYVCTGGKNSSNFLPGTLLKDSQQYVTTTVDKDWAVGYDMNDTIIQKICMTSVNYDYDGGWVVHGLECNFKEHCGGKDVGGFPRLRDTKKAMQMKFTKCDYTN